MLSRPATLQKIILHAEDWHVGVTSRNAIWPLEAVTHELGQEAAAVVGAAVVTWAALLDAVVVVGGAVVNSFGTHETVLAPRDPHGCRSQNRESHDPATFVAQPPKQTSGPGMDGTCPAVQRYWSGRSAHGRTKQRARLHPALAARHVGMHCS